MTEKSNVKQYLEKLDWRVNENANNGSPSFSGLMLYLANTEIAKWALDEVYPKHVSKAHKSGDLHIHDLSYSNTIYCSGWSLGDLIKEGINKISGKASSAPAKHLSSLMIQMVNFLGCLQMEQAGAQAFNNVDTHLAPFIKKDNLTFEQVKQYTQQLIFNLNIPSRWGSQAVFSNFTFDLKCPKDMANKKAIVGGIEQDFTYSDCQKEMDLFNLAFIEIMEEGDSDGQIHTFPIPTYNIDENFEWDIPIANKLFSMTAKYGTPYFSNYINSDMDAQSVRSMCPMTPDTMLLVKSNQNGISIKPIGEIYSNNNRSDTEYEVWTKQGWNKCKPIQIPKTKVYKITLSNGVEVKFGENHLQPIMGGKVLKTSELEESMWLPFNKDEIDFAKIKNHYDEYAEEDNNYKYYKIEKIEEYNYTGQYLYCLEVYNDDMQFMLANGLITHNCRLRLDLSQLRKKTGGFFGSADLTGSIGVCTLNLPRIGYTSKTKKSLFNKINKLMDIAKESLDIKRKKIQETLDSGLLHYTSRYLKQGLINHFSTIGIIGMNECLENFMNKNITTKEGNAFANEILDHINKRLSKYQEESPDKVLYNLEATPAEATSYRLAKIDKENYPDIKTANDVETPYYTNSVHLPVGYTDDIFEMLELEDEMQSKFTSGTVIHLYLGEQVDSGEKVKQLIKRIFTNYKLPYISVTPTFSTCIDHGYIKGEVYECPTCGKATEVWSRVTGYWRPISSYNKGKKQEFKDRKYYSIGSEVNV